MDFFVKDDRKAIFIILMHKNAPYFLIFETFKGRFPPPTLWCHPCSYMYSVSAEFVKDFQQSNFNWFSYKYTELGYLILDTLIYFYFFGRILHFSFCLTFT